MLAIYLYLLACVYFYWLEADEPHGNDFLHLAELALWPVVLPIYMAVLWVKERRGE
jgi:hypothetical protein